ncbi:MAG: hypothetical protein ACPGVD_10335, partial [Flavobacteriales bacterium]
MKKKILFVAALFAGSLAFAQGSTTSMKNKRGLEYLPQAGDWALQFDAVPLIDFGLNAVKFNTNTSATAQHLGYVGGFNNVIVGKMYTSATEAYRVKVGINFMSNNTETVQMYGANNDQEYVTTQNDKVTNIVLGFGKEWRRGHNRLQGFYGGEALLVIGSPTTTTSFEYNLDLQTAISDAGATSPRSLGVTKSSAFGIGARGFIGVDYFILPKIAIGAEFGWGIGFSTSSGEVT